MSGHYERLSQMDSVFLDIEDDSAHMHLGGVMVFDAAPIKNEHGGVDVDRLRAYTETILRYVPRYRQRLGFVPVTRQPVWMDDDRFNLAYHVRHTALPRPGDDARLRELAGRIFSQKLDRGRPLWELHVVEGLEGDRFAIIAKVHHCMIDGIAGVDLIMYLLKPNADGRIKAGPPEGWAPRPGPRAGDLAFEELRRRATSSMSLLRAARDAWVQKPAEVTESLKSAASGFGDILGTGLVTTSATPFNPAVIGPHRRFAWTETSLETIKRIRRMAAGTVNDVVLAIVAGAARRYLASHHLPVDRMNFRALVPMSVRGEAERGQLGNKLTLLLCQLPVDEPDPRQRLRKVVDETRRMKWGGQAQGGQLAQRVAEHTGRTFISQAIKLAGKIRAFNVVVTNVPGPQFPMYLLGARMRAMSPLVPLYANQGLGIALFSYEGKLFWGLNADYDAVPDLDRLVADIDAEIAELDRAAAEPAPELATEVTSAPTP